MMRRVIALMMIMILLTPIIPLFITENNTVRAEETLDADSLVLVYIITMDDKLKTQIPDVDVYIDGSKVGTTNETGALTILTIKGMHTLKFASDGYETKTITIYIGNDCPVTVYMKPIEGGIPYAIYIIYAILLAIIISAIVVFYNYKKKGMKFVKIKGV